MLDRKNVKTHVNEFYKFKDEIAIIGTFIGDNDATIFLMGSIPKTFVGIIIVQTWNINTLIDTTNSNDVGIGLCGVSLHATFT